jgi:hypothetical protein
MHVLTTRARLIALISLLALAVIATGCTGGEAAPTATIGVNALTADPTAYAGEIAVKGIVQNVDPQGSTMSIIDEDEYATCGLTPCNSAGILPLMVPSSGEPSLGGALYEGEMPALEDPVIVVGKVAQSQQGLYFDVTRVMRGQTTIIEKR